MTRKELLVEAIAFLKAQEPETGDEMADVVITQILLEEELFYIEHDEAAIRGLDTLIGRIIQ